MIAVFLWALIMQVQRTNEQIERDDKERAIWLAGQSVSNVQAKEIHKRHKQYAKRAKNLSKGDKHASVIAAMKYERLLLEQRLTEINNYLGGL